MKQIKVVSCTILLAIFTLVEMSFKTPVYKMHLKQTELSENKIFRKLGTNFYTENCLRESLNTHFVPQTMNLLNSNIF